jgi:hypothetical protein
VGDGELILRDKKVLIFRFVRLLSPAIKLSSHLWHWPSPPEVRRPAVLVSAYKNAGISPHAAAISRNVAREMRV